MSTSNNKILIRKTDKDDLPDILRMLKELAALEEKPDGSILTIEDLIRDGGFDSQTHPLFFSFIAEFDGKPVGYTISFFSFSSWKGKSFYLEDIYVEPEFRKFGIGKKLFIENVKFARSTNCNRLDFQVLNWNPAKVFYEKLGAKNLSAKEGWESFRLEASDMDDLLKHS